MSHYRKPAKCGWCGHRYTAIIQVPASVERAEDRTRIAVWHQCPACSRKQTNTTTAAALRAVATQPKLPGMD